MKPFLLVLLWLFTCTTFAQSPIQVGKRHTIHSEYLGEERTIQIYLPQGYDETEKSYPTLYILDGQWYFLNGVSILENQRGNAFPPQMIVVGIEMERPKREATLNEQWDEFKQFISLELTKYVDDHFRTTDDRIIFGWENAGFMVCELILSKDQVFEGAISSNGAYIDENMLMSFDSLKSRKYLYLANSTKDIFTVSYTNETAKVLKSANSENLIWDYKQYNDEIHESLANISLYQGLKFYYHNFPSLMFSSIEAFDSIGGLNYVRHYYETRAKRFGMSNEIDESAKNSLIWMAWKEGEFEHFDLFMNEFSDVLETKRYASAYWQNRLAQFYLKNESYDQAVKFFQQGISKYPDDKFMARMHGGLGEAYLGLGQKKNAKSEIKNAIQIAMSNNDPDLAKYKKLLTTLQ